jgi:hypothetical protein
MARLCWDCKEPVKESANVCPHCGRGFPEYGPLRDRKVYSANQAYGIVLLCIGGIAALVLLAQLLGS